VQSAKETKEYLDTKNSSTTKVVKVKGPKKCFNKKCPLGHLV